MSFDPWISEWGNPPVYILLLLRIDAHSVPALGRSGACVAAERLSECKTRYHTLNT